MKTQTIFSGNVSINHLKANTSQIRYSQKEWLQLTKSFIFLSTSLADGGGVRYSGDGLKTAGDLTGDPAGP